MSESVSNSNGWAKIIVAGLIGAIAGAAGVLYQFNARVIVLETEMAQIRTLPGQLERLDDSIGKLNTNIELLRHRLNRVDPDGR